ncbi:TOMM precursor leader peptide-binding protein [Actinomyces johnsonii]|uniref:TOMM leader peptide-binding protein n=1 Tax=Actinomyces johnsonii TaxID=544581 RepID=A0A508A6X3_9ACTO|nr:TOMM precursor leader peptide-binding protein [Actinomyces johnsonii]KAA8738370.1 TOMM precursor leader peptide-binding protein [Actinomyces johnsonii]TQD41512.1 TOMM precursor leader peptide-binding protein [Actinomyces johnsonii]
MAGDTTGSVMRAGDVGRAARRDLQFRIPRKPVVRLGLRARPDEGGWIVDGARKSQVLGGAFAREHMGPLLEACDGTRTLDEIGEATGIGPQAAFEAVSLLWTGGIVEEGDTEPAPGEPAPELARLLSRLGDSTGVNDSWQDAARRLAAARVAVVGDAELAGEMVAALEPTLPDVRLDGAPRQGDTLVVLIETIDFSDRSEEVARRCRQDGIPLLRVRAEHEAVTIGPYVDESFSPCLACASADEPELGPRPDAARRDIVIGLAARAVAALIARATVTHLPGDARRTDLATFTYSDRPVVSRPGCPVCSVAGQGETLVPVAPSAPVGARYEQSVVIPPAAFVDSKGHQQHYKPSNLRLQREFRDWPVCPRTQLPPADLGRLDQPWPVVHPIGGGDADAAVRPTLSELATILALSVGVREPLGTGSTDPGAADAAQTPLSAKLRRWTAAGGNIGSVTAYVLVPESGEAGEVGGEQLAPGTYVYIERDHALALIGPAPSVSETDVVPDGVGVRIVLTGNVDKVARKYFSFALRIAVQDCGCSFEVIRLVADALGVPLRARARWDEQRIARALGTDPAREPACIVVDLGGSRAH